MATLFKVVNKLGVGLNKSLLRHTVLSNNLANLNTPGFKRSDVTVTGQFKAELNRASGSRLNRTNARHLPGNSLKKTELFSVVQDRSSVMRNDGNNVDPDREKVLITENQLHYDSLIDAVSRKLSQLRTVIGEGRR
ncbi:MAG: flagellar basal body rod protein FlgB [Bacillota bacterium]|mgnify:FL=1|nr:flagellar basal body rod protein FlgB [Bacillota bacterium]